jgi:NtrC-family two-component system response regulator AlgB
VTVEARACRVLVVDDQKNIRSTLSLCVQASGADVCAVGTGEAALAAIGRQSYDLAFVDLKLGTENGLDVMSELMVRQRSLATILITAYGTAETVGEATRRGVWEYLPKPFTPSQVRALLDRFRSRSSVGAPVKAR